MNALSIPLAQMGPGYHQMGWGWTGWLDVLSAVVFALLLAAAVFAVFRLVLLPVLEGETPGAETKTDADPALTTLRERFARGEIDEAEYERRMAVLGREA